MGNTTQALRLIIEEMGDVDRAIEFAKEHDDTALWDELIDASMDKPCEYLCLSTPCLIIVIIIVACCLAHMSVTQ